ILTTPHAHEECGLYAIQVCPFLAVPTYSKLIEDKTLKPEAVHDTARFHNDQIAPKRPLVFVLARTSGITLTDADDGSGKKYILPRRPWKEVEFWLTGKQITLEDAAAILQDS